MKPSVVRAAIVPISGKKPHNALFLFPSKAANRRPVTYKDGVRFSACVCVCVCAGVEGGICGGRQFCLPNTSGFPHVVIPPVVHINSFTVKAILII